MSKNALVATLGVAALLFVGFLVWNSASNPNTVPPNSISVEPNFQPPAPPPPAPPAEPAVPTVRTDANAIPSLSTVVVRGTVTPNGAPTTYWFEYGESTALGIRTSAQSIGSGFVSIYTPAYITGLKSNTTYWYRLGAQNRFGTVNGDTFSFKTNSAPLPQGSVPAVRTLAATDVTRISAILNGQITPNSSETTYWFEYGETADFGSVTSFQSAGAGTAQASASASISGLQPLTRYFFRLNAQNRFGTVNGGVQSFTTQGPAEPGLPTVTSTSVSSITPSSARLGAQVNPNGAPTAYHFEYSTDQSFVNALRTPEATIPAGSSASVTANISGLLGNTTYYYRLILRNQLGTTVGTTASFTTR